MLPPYKWLNEHGYFSSYEVMKKYPQAFAHIKTSTDKKFEIYQAQKKTKRRWPNTSACQGKDAGRVQRARRDFNPTSLQIEPGAPEADWLQIGRALASVCQSAYWWVGDWLQYGFRTYGKKTTYDLAQQATGYTRTQLYECAYIAKRFPPERRVGALTFFHHKCVAKFRPLWQTKCWPKPWRLG